MHSKINALATRTQEPNLLNDIQHALHAGRAMCFGDNENCIVVKPLAGGMHIWLAIQQGKETLANYSFIEEMARQTNIPFIQFETKRKGFDRVAVRHGYVHVGDRDNYKIWRKEL